MAVAGPSLAPATVHGAGTRRSVAVAVCCAGAFIAFLDTTIVNVAFPSIQRTFSASVGLSSLSWVVNGYNVVIAALLVPAGRAADRLGRRRAFAVGLIVFTIASAACAVADSVSLLIALRYVQAIGAAILVPTSLGLLLPQFQPRHRLSAVSLWGAASALAAGVGPSLGGALVDAWSWRAVFLVNVPIGLVTAWGVWRGLDEEREAGPLPDLFGAVLLIGALALLALGIVKGDEWHWDGAGTLACLSLSIVGLVIVGVRCMHQVEPVIAPRLIATRAAAIGNLVTLLLSVALYAAILNNILFLTDVWHWSVLAAGLAITPAPLITAVVARPAGRLAERVGARVVVVPGVVVYALGMLFLVWGAGRGASFVTHWLPGAVLAGIGMGLTLPTVIGAVLAGAPEAKLATASGINAAARQLGAVLGVAVLVSILAAGSYDKLAAHRTGWLMAAGCALGAGAVALGLARRADEG